MANTPNTMRKNEERLGAGFAEQVDKARDAASSLVDKAKEAASSASERASEMASDLGEKAENATAAVGSTMKSLAGSMREHAPASGMLKSATTSVADTLESSGRYLEETGLSGLGKDLTSLVRRNPLPAVMLGIGLGFLIARATRR